jgi:SAM-dependent methyltransferase
MALYYPPVRAITRQPPEFLVTAPIHDLKTPSEWVIRWADRVPSGGRVLDLACGAGRHSRYFVGRGCTVEAVDRDPAVLAGLSDIPGIATRCADLEGASWPYGGQVFAAIVVTNYLHRPLFPHILTALAPLGLLIYETFALGNERYGRPSNPEFLLKPGELLEVARGRLQVLGFEERFVAEPKPALIQRICAINSKLEDIK